MNLEPIKRVAVLCGGNSSEREISLKSADAVMQALIDAHYHVVKYDLKTCQLPNGIENFEVVFPLIHGGFGEDGRLQALLEARDIPYVGNSSKTCAILMDKLATKKKCVENGIPTPHFTIMKRGETKLPEGFQLPVVLKIANEGSSFGIEIPETAEAFSVALEKLFKNADELLIEEFIDGLECTIPVICDKPYPIIELRVPGKFYDFDAKYTYKQGATEYLCPPQNIPEELQEKIKNIAMHFCEVFNVRDIVRIDFMIDKAGNPHVLEGNAIPGATTTSLVPKSARVAGLRFPTFVGYLVESRTREMMCESL